MSEDILKELIYIKDLLKRFVNIKAKEYSPEDFILIDWLLSDGVIKAFEAGYSIIDIINFWRMKHD